MEWKSFIALKQGRRQVPRIGDLERLASILRVDSAYVFQVARGTAAEEISTVLGRETELRAILDRVGEGVFTINLDGQLRDVNDALAAMLDRPAPALVGRSLVELIAPESAPHVLRCLAATRQGSAFSAEIDFVTVDGERRTAEIDAVPIRRADGHAMGAQILARDVTERQKLMRELGSNRSLLQMIFDHVPAACIVFEADGTISAANPLVASVCPHTATELVGKQASTVLGDPGPTRCPVTRAFLSGAIEQQVSWMINREGRRVYVHRTAGPICDGDRVVRVIELMVDVTSQIHQGDLRVLAFWRGQAEDLEVADSPERRAFPRAQVAFDAKLRFGRSTFDVRVTSLGAGGLLLETAAKVPVGTRIELSWTLPVDNIPVRASGVAVWSKLRGSGKRGVGVRFTAIEPRSAVPVRAS